MVLLQPRLSIKTQDFDNFPLLTCDDCPHHVSKMKSLGSDFKKKIRCVNRKKLSLNSKWLTSCSVEVIASWDFFRIECDLHVNWISCINVKLAVCFGHKRGRLSHFDPPIEQTNLCKISQCLTCIQKLTSFRAWESIVCFVVLGLFPFYKPFLSLGVIPIPVQMSTHGY